MISPRMVGMLLVAIGLGYGIANVKAEESGTRPRRVQNTMGFEPELDVRLPSLPAIRAMLHDRVRRDIVAPSRSTSNPAEGPRTATRHFAGLGEDASEEQEPPLLDPSANERTNALPRGSGRSRTVTVPLDRWYLEF